MQCAVELMRTKMILCQNFASLPCGTIETYLMFQMFFFFPREKSISREKSGTSRNDVSLPCTPGNAIMLQHLIPSFLSIICQEVAYERLKTKDKFNLFALKVVVVPNVRWSFTKDSKCNDLTRKLLMFWKTGG